MKTLNCRTITEYSASDFSKASTALLMKMNSAGWSVKDFTLDTAAIKEPAGNEVLAYTAFYIFEFKGESDDDA